MTLARKEAAGEGVSLHEMAAIEERQSIPGLRRFAALRHWIEAHIRHVRRGVWIKASPHVLALPFGGRAPRERSHIIGVADSSAARSRRLRELGGDVIQACFGDAQEGIVRGSGFSPFPSPQCVLSRSDRVY